MEIDRFESYSVEERSSVGQARRAATAFAEDSGFDTEDAGRVGVIATEAATNLVKHAERGELVLGHITDGEAHGVALIALDRGPGIRNLAQSLIDGHSTAGSPGNGLGAIRRMSSQFDIYTNSAGTAVLSYVWAKNREAPPARCQIGAVCMPYPGERECGDQWAMRVDGDDVVVLLADGLGHGTMAAAAARKAADTLTSSHTPAAPADILAAVHDALRSTRGAAAAVARIEPRRGVVRYSGVGNIAGTIATGEVVRHMVSHHGILGHSSVKIQEFTYPWSADWLLLLHSDGISTRWALGAYPGLTNHHPMLTAAVLYRDFRRSTDDASLVALRFAG
ncbi:MAG TPA: SpoIIE family protein phosphatase [Terriglobales bacterium]|nr:SpoIIE family protein phosphatase [Terriglobales bacterium]